MQGIADGAIKLGFVGRLEHDAEIIAVSPVTLLPELRLDTLVENSTWQRIGK